MYDIWSTTIEHMRFMTYDKEMQKLYHMSYHMFTICYKSISVPYVQHMVHFIRIYKFIKIAP